MLITKNMNTKKISQYIGILIIVAITTVSAFTPPSSEPNNNNVFPFIDSGTLQNIKAGTGTQGGLAVELFSVGQAARFDGMVFINSFISGLSPEDPDISIGSASTRSRLLAEGNVEAGGYLQADNLRNGSMRRVCRDPQGYLVLCPLQQTPPDACPNIEGIQSQTWLDANRALFVKDGSGNCVKEGDPVPVPQASTPTIEVRRVVFSTKKFNLISLEPFSLLTNPTVEYATLAYRINFGTPTTAPISFNTGYCVNHSSSTPMSLCYGMPERVRTYNILAEPDVARNPSIPASQPGNALMTEYEFSGLHPQCSYISPGRGNNCPPGLRGPGDAAILGRNDVIIPAGTLDTGWMLHTSSRWTEDQKLNPHAYRPRISYVRFYSFWSQPGRNSPYRNMVRDMTNAYFFNVNDPSGRFKLENFTNLSNPKHKIIIDAVNKY